MNETISILHLSDFHFNTKEKKATVINKQKELIDSLVKKINSFDKPDFLVISGDIAYHGSNKEYILANEDLIKNISIDNNNIIIVPGNHDKAVYGHLNSIQKEIKSEDEIDKITDIKKKKIELLKYDEKVKEFLESTDTKAIKDINYRYYNFYNNFCSPIIKKDFLCNRFLNDNIRNDFTCGLYDYREEKKVIFVCFNTTYLCFGGPIDFDRLIFDEVFIDEVEKKLKEINASNEYPVISVMHHNPGSNWINWNEKYPLKHNSNLERILNFSNIIISGHEHCIKTKPDLLNNQTQQIIGGAVLDSGGGDIRYNFSLIELNFITKKFQVNPFIYDPIYENKDPWKPISNNDKYSYEESNEDYKIKFEELNKKTEELERENQMLKDVVFKEKLRKSIDSRFKN